MKDVSRRKLLHTSYKTRQLLSLDLVNTADRSTIFKLLGRPLIISCKTKSYSFNIMIAITMNLHIKSLEKEVKQNRLQVENGGSLWREQLKNLSCPMGQATEHSIYIRKICILDSNHIRQILSNHM